MSNRLSFMISLLILAGCSPRGITVNQAWARPALSGNNSAVYFEIENRLGDDVLLGARADMAEAVEIHETMPLSESGNAEEGHDMADDHPVGGDIMTMVKQERIEFPKNTRIVFEPGGLHVMLVGVQTELRVGDTIMLTLLFEQAGEITFEATVQE